MYPKKKNVLISFQQFLGMRPLSTQKMRKGLSPPNYQTLTNGQPIQCPRVSVARVLEKSRERPLLPSRETGTRSEA